MDDATVNWSKERFDECSAKLKPYLRSCGFKVKTEVKFRKMGIYRYFDIGLVFG